jgi:nucleoside-diphosphate-sugar epimerase
LKKILVTGAFGYLGAKICQHFDELGYLVTALDSKGSQDTSGWLSNRAEIIIGDITDYGVITDLAGRGYDILIHLISLDHKASEREPSLISNINVMPAWNILDLFQHHGLGTFIYFSTFHVYGEIETERITEETKLHPKNKYALTHLLTESIVNYYNQNSSVNCINLRLTNSYGSPVFIDNNCWWLVINDLCRSAFYEKKMTLLSDGTPQRDFIHSSDICSAVQYFVSNNLDSPENNTFNLSSGRTYTIKQLADEIKSIFRSRYNLNIPIDYKTQPKDTKDDSSETMKYVVDNSRIKRLGVSFQTSIREGVEDLLNYFERLESEEVQI